MNNEIAEFSLSLSLNNKLLVFISLIVSLLALVYAFIIFKKMLKKSQGTKRMAELSEIIYKGARIFLKKEYKTMAIFTSVITVFLWLFISPAVSITFVGGTIFSAIAADVSMRSATRANARTAYATKRGINEGLKVAFSSGTITGMANAGIGLGSVIVAFLIFKDPEILYGFGLGASLTALFARVGGGVFTKAADVGADLVGKVEKDLPEDDPRNPAAIADNVGDNVGDIAGMGSDLFESYVESIIAAMVLGVAIFGEKGIVLPIILAAAGIISAFVGGLFVNTKEGGNVYKAIDKGTFVSAGIMIVGAFLIIQYYAQDIGLFYATITGLITGVIIGYSTEYMTSTKKKPAQKIAESAKTGAATCIISGFATGMTSTVIPMITIAIAMLIAHSFGGLYGIAIAAVGMLSIVGMSLAADAYGPVVDNAAGISEMAKMGKNIRRRTELLDEVGNTTAAASRGLQLGASALTVLALFASFIQITKVEIINLNSPEVIAGIFVGAIVPFIFSALIINGVGKAAHDMVLEIRRQFKKDKNILKGKTKPNYNRCIEISTDRALKEMMIPGIISVITPILIGLYSIESLGGFLMGTITTGVMLSMFMSNAGCAWDNAKKYIEEGKFGGKGSEAHKAAVVGDTVGDPLKDAAGPSLDILIKLVITSSLVFIPFFI